jgi:hypothetical protein
MGTATALPISTPTACAGPASIWTSTSTWTSISSQTPSPPPPHRQLHLHLHRPPNHPRLPRPRLPHRPSRSCFPQHRPHCAFQLLHPIRQRRRPNSAYGGATREFTGGGDGEGIGVTGGESGAASEEGGGVRSGSEGCGGAGG